MANLVVALYNQLLETNGLSPYFYALLNGLKEAGNNVLCFQRQFTKIQENSDIPKSILKQIKSFKPDGFIFINNQFWDITPYFDQPIVILNVDSVNFFQNLDVLRERKDRYSYVSITFTGVKNIIESIGVSKKNVLYLQPFTEIKPINMSKTIPIGFCENFWLWDDFKMIQDFIGKNPTDLEREEAKRVFQNFLKFPFKKPQEYYDSINTNTINKLSDDSLDILSTRLSGIRRLRYLTAIADLGLEIRGQYWTRKIKALSPFPEVLLCYSSKVVNNFETTQEFYNQCKIGFNTKHIQAQSGFSWRCADILASSACLVSEKAKDFEKLGFRVPSFESEIEAREVCQKILKNDNLRSDLIHYNNELIDKKYRFKHALPTLEELIGFSLNPGGMGSLQIVRTDTPQKKCKPQMNFKNQVRYKIWKHLNKKLKKKGII